MSTTTRSPEGFLDHHDEPFLRTWALLEYLTCVAATEAVDAVTELTWAHIAYTDDGLRRPAPDAFLEVPAESAEVEQLVRALDELLAHQLEAVETDLAEALRLRRTRGYVHRALETL